MVAINSLVNLRPRTNGRVSRGSKQNKIREALDLQDEMKRRAYDVDTNPAQSAACVRAWKELQEEIRQLRGQAALAPVKAEPKSRQSARSARLHVEPLEVLPVPGSTAEPPPDRT